MSIGSSSETVAVENLRKYLQIPSVQPNPDYSKCVKFLKEQSDSIGLQFNTYEVVAKKPVVILTWKGSSPELPSILLNSHMDVVPVFPEFWDHDPFGAEKDENGNIYARGAQDMKSVGIQYLEAVRKLKSQGTNLKRTVHLSFVPDEEIGGFDGMKKFVKTSHFEKMNVGFVLDEGHASPDDTLWIFNAERNIWQIEFIVNGASGHGSLLIPNTPGEKLSSLISKIMVFRQSELDKLYKDETLSFGNVTTINLTMLKGGKEPNVIPPELSATFDFRLALTVDNQEFENQINQWVKESGEGIHLNWIQKNTQVTPTKMDSSNKFWTAIKKVFEEMNIKTRIATFPGGTDGKYCRQLNIPVIGFSHILNTPILLHSHNEFINEKAFLDGIKVYEKVIPAIANV